MHPLETLLRRRIPIPIAATTLFHYLADFTSTRLWDPNVLDAHDVKKDQQIGLGQEFILDFKMGPSIIQIRYEITLFEPPHKIILKGTHSSFTIEDRMTISQDTNSHYCNLDYEVAIQFNHHNNFKLKLIRPLVNMQANKTVRNLRRLALPDNDRIKQAARWMDKLVIPALLDFTRHGFVKMKKSANPIPIHQSKAVAVITGSTSGIGFEIATELARAGMHLVMINRSADKAHAIKTSLEARFKITVDCFTADFSDVIQVHEVASAIAKHYPKIHVLINNAGELLHERIETAQGYERHFAVLLLSPFILMQQLKPQLLASGQPNNPARVINMCSGGLYSQPLVLGDLQYKEGEFNGPKAYARAKRALLDVTEQAARMYDKNKIVFHAMHPGWAHTPGVERSLPVFLKRTQQWLRTPYQGADTAVWLAVSNTAGKASGLFWLDRRCHTTAMFPGTRTTPSTQAALYEQLKLMTHSISDQNSNEVSTDSSTDTVDNNIDSERKTG